MLEQQIKRLKMMAPKGKISAKTWQRLSRNLDATNSIVPNGLSLLNLTENDGYRFTNIECEIIMWRAHLRFSEYLHTQGDKVFSIHGELLNDCLVNFGSNIKQKRLEYYEMALSTPLENIRYNNLNIQSFDIMDEIEPAIINYESESEMDL